ncbi:hypothetical protein QCA50_017444 [Cerrena zonata]|uniref:Mediator of RNA polymerase II transcription subunit 13 n=1 Tax=Cerrena zonata TaxID=2478898 RepID=A0AAW0FF62_9APHY
MTNSMMNDIFDISMAPNESMNFFQNETKDTHQDQKGNHLNEGDQMIENQEEQENQANEEDQLDDLFGDDSSDEDQSESAKPIEPQFDNNFEQQPSSQPIEVDEESKPIQTDKDSTKELDLFYETQQDETNKELEKDVEKEFKEPKPRPSTTVSNSTYIDIPKDQMTIAPLRYLKTQTPQVYDDPGAPLPIVPTPIIPSSAPQSSGTIPDQKNLFNDQKNLNFHNNHLGHFGTSWTPSGAPEIDNKSVFSPLLFNPIIKSNIDTKYGKGGKFYVDKELSAGSDSESKKRKLRATSVSGYEYPVKKEDRGHSFDILNERGLGIIRSENQDRGIVSNEDNENAIADDDDPSDQSDDEEEEEEEEESDEDEDINQNKIVDHSKEQNSPPLKLNTNNDQGSSNQGNNLDTTQKQVSQSTLTNSGGFFSPLGQAAKYNTGSKFDSPLGMNSSFVDNNQMVTGSPSSIFDNKQLQPPPSAPVFQDDFQGHESFSPDDDSKKDQSPSLFTNLVKSPPSKLQFKFLSNGGKESTSLAYNDDIFLHLAYERTVDKNWVSAAWSDPFGVTTHVKSWYCSPTNNKKHTKDIYEMGEVIDEIWNISNELFKTLNAEIIKKTSGLGGKKFLVLTRINNVIPDDELVHWKRLSMKYKDVSLIVLSVNRTPRVLFNVDFTSNRDVSPDDNDLVQDDASNASSNNNVGLSTAAATIAGSSNSTTGLNSSGNTVVGQAQPSSTSGLLTGLNQQQQGQQNSSSNIVSGGQKNAAPTGMGSATTPSAPGSAPDFFKNFNNFPPSSNSSPTTTGATMITSPSHNGGINFHSPQQFLNAPGNFLSPQDLVGTGASGTTNNVATNGHSTVGAGVDGANGPGIIFNESDVVLHDRNSDITAVIPRTALPSFTSPSKLGMKIGYLLKECGNDSEEVGDGGSVKKYLVYETTILSCSNFWKLDAIMKIMLEQYKKLISLNDILGLTEIQTSTSSTKLDVTTDNLDQQEVDHKDAVLLVPWHINAVGKSLDYLIHVSVEE